MADKSSLLISAEQLAGMLENEPESRAAGSVVVVDCRFNLLDPAAGRQAWLEGHIPGAVYADLDMHLASPITPTSGRHPLPDPERFAVLLARWGITPATLVVAYDDVGGAVAARLWWLLRWVGHERVSLLDGGLAAWQELGLRLSQDTPQPAQGRYPVAPGALPVATAEEVRTGLAEAALVLLDARDNARFAGELEPIDSVAGHVPGAINRPFQSNLDARSHFRAEADLKDSFAAILPASDARVVSMCGSGVTACHNLFALELAGYAGKASPPALYVGSWSEWIKTGNPIGP